MSREEGKKVAKTLRITVDIPTARKMLMVAGHDYEKIYGASDMEIFELVIAQLEDYGGSARFVF